MRIYVTVFVILISTYVVNASLLEPVVENIVHHEVKNPPSDVLGIWRKKTIWKPRWVKEWKSSKVTKPVWRKVWSPVHIKEWVPIPKPPPGWESKSKRPVPVKTVTDKIPFWDPMSYPESQQPPPPPQDFDFKLPPPTQDFDFKPPPPTQDFHFKPPPPPPQDFSFQPAPPLPQDINIQCRGNGCGADLIETFTQEQISKIIGAHRHKKAPEYTPGVDNSEIMTPLTQVPAESENWRLPRQSPYHQDNRSNLLPEPPQFLVPPKYPSFVTDYSSHLKNHKKVLPQQALPSSTVKPLKPQIPANHVNPAKNAGGNQWTPIPTQKQVNYQSPAHYKPTTNPAGKFQSPNNHYAKNNHPIHNNHQIKNNHQINNNYQVNNNHHIKNNHQVKNNNQINNNHQIKNNHHQINNQHQTNNHHQINNNHQTNNHHHQINNNHQMGGNNAVNHKQQTPTTNESVQNQDGKNHQEVTNQNFQRNSELIQPADLVGEYHYSDFDFSVTVKPDLNSNFKQESALKPLQSPTTTKSSAPMKFKPLPQETLSTLLEQVLSSARTQQPPTLPKFKPLVLEPVKPAPQFAENMKQIKQQMQFQPQFQNVTKARPTRKGTDFPQRENEVQRFTPKPEVVFEQEKAITKEILPITESTPNPFSSTHRFAPNPVFKPSTTTTRPTNFNQIENVENKFHLYFVYPEGGKNPTNDSEENLLKALRKSAPTDVRTDTVTESRTEKSTELPLTTSSTSTSTHSKVEVTTKSPVFIVTPIYVEKS